MKLFLISSAICLIVLTGQTSAFRVSELESESGNTRESVKVNIRQKETIRQVEPPCSCNQKARVFINTDDSVREEKGRIFVNRAQPVHVTGKSRRVVVPAGEPIVVKPEPVVIRQKGDIEVRPIHITKQPPPLIVTKKIVKLHQPIIKKYYVEKYRKHEGNPEHIVSQRVSKKVCNCPTSEHLISPKHDWYTEDKSHSIQRSKDWYLDGDSHSIQHSDNWDTEDNSHSIQRSHDDDSFTQSIKVLQSRNGEVVAQVDVDEDQF